MSKTEKVRLADRRNVVKPALRQSGQANSRRKSRAILPEPYFILRAELRRIVPYSMQHILRLEKRSQFPARVIIGKNRVAWVRTEVMSWVRARVMARGVAPKVDEEGVLS